MTSTDVARQQPATGALAVSAGQTEWTEAQQAALVQLWHGKVPPRGDLLVLMNHAQRTGLDPFTRQLYMIERGGRWGIQTAIDGFRVVAERTGKYAGQLDPEWCGDDGVWRDVWLAPTPPRAARVAVLRRDFEQPLRAVSLWSEYGQSTGLWRTMPALMLAKCAEAQALRKAFPQDLSGLYTADEMGQQDGQQQGARVVEHQPVIDAAALGTVWSSVIASRTDDQLKTAWEAGKASGVLDLEVEVPGEWEVPDQRVPLGRLVIMARRRIAEGKLPPEPAVDAPVEGTLEGDPSRDDVPEQSDVEVQDVPAEHAEQDVPAAGPIAGETPSGGAWTETVAGPGSKGGRK